MGHTQTSHAVQHASLAPPDTFVPTAKRQIARKVTTAQATPSRHRLATLDLIRIGRICKIKKAARFARLASIAREAKTVLTEVASLDIIVLREARLIKRASVRRDTIVIQTYQQNVRRERLATLLT